MMNRSRHQHSKHPRQPAGFTLVEMLVSVTLVLLMMTMFASIFQMATDSVSKQRGIAENDQRARTLTTIIRADFAKRTNRYPLPYYQGESSATSPTPFGIRAGYLYISTNDTYSGLDDIIQFSVSANNISENPDETPYFGASKLLYDRIAEDAGVARRTTIRFNPNQPEADDGQIFANNVSSSSAAEVCYFVRNGNLIRRVMLLREPLPIAGEDYSIEPRSNVQDNEYFIDATHASGAGAGNGGLFYYVGNPGAINQSDSSNANHFALNGSDTPPTAWDVRPSNDFWNHFDFSAVPKNFASNVPDNVHFIGIDSLNNESTGSTFYALGKPNFRFGFNPVTGVSREYESGAATALFLGRFLQAETSDVNFNWPLAPTIDDAGGTGPIGNGNPMDAFNTTLTLNRVTGVVAEYDGLSPLLSTFGRGGGRQVEDLLLSNVHEFRIEIWDERMGRWVTPGHRGTTTIPGTGGATTQGDFNRLRRLNVNYGPFRNQVTSRNNVFDTWHPGTIVDLDANGSADGNQSPPFIAYSYYPPRAPNGPSPASMQDPTTEIDPRTGTATNKGYWQLNTTYAVGDVVFAPWTDSASGPLADGAFQYSEIPEPKFQIGFRCIHANGSSTLGDTGTSDPTNTPTWSRVADKRISDGQLIWQSFDNRRPLKSIRMTIRFFDQNTQNIRQVKLVLPLTAH